MRVTGIRAVWVNLACVVLLSLCLPSAPAHASKASDNLVARGIVQLNGGKFVAATKYFNGAVQADSKDPRALFFLGVALNRLGQHGAALDSFQRMWRLKVTHRELGLEGGWAAIAQGRTALAITLLEPYVKANPKNAKAREFLGRAYIGDGRLDDAERELKAALALDPRLKPTASFYLGNVAVARGDTNAAGVALGDILKDAPGSNIGRALRSKLQQAQDAERAGSGRKPWSLYAGFSVGTNSNAIGIGNGIVLPSDISSRRSNYAVYDIGGRYQWEFSDRRALVVGYGASHQRYSNLDGINSLAHNVFARYSHPLTETIVARIDATGAIIGVDGETSLRSGGLQPAISFRLFENVQAEAFVGHTNANYRSPTTNAAVLNRDSITRTYGGKVTFVLPSVRTSIDVGYVRTINDADGGDYDYEGHRYSLGATTRLPLQITANVNYAFANNNYQNLNSLAPTNPPGAFAFGFARRDRVKTFGLRLSRPFIGPTTVFLQAQRTVNHSNISAFNYNQDDIRLGITATF